MRTKIFLEEGTMEVAPVCSAHRASMIVHELLECYNVAKEEIDEEDPGNTKVPHTEGEPILEGLELESAAYAEPLNTQKVIGMKGNRKFAHIGDY
jgi:hypothetical protein